MKTIMKFLVMLSFLSINLAAEEDKDTYEIWGEIGNSKTNPTGIEVSIDGNKKTMTYKELYIHVTSKQKEIIKNAQNIVDRLQDAFTKSTLSDKSQLEKSLNRAKGLVETIEKTKVTKEESKDKGSTACGSPKKVTTYSVYSSYDTRLKNMENTLKSLEEEAKVFDSLNLKPDIGKQKEQIQQQLLQTTQQTVQQTTQQTLQQQIIDQMTTQNGGGGGGGPAPDPILVDPCFLDPTACMP